MAGHVVATAPDGEEEPLVARKFDAIDDVGLARAPDDESRSAIYREVLDSPVLIESGVAGTEDRPPELHAKFDELLVAEINRFAAHGCE
ncbi:MAG TPA: hypothetical protein VM282_10430 [Acidimicrobiales bacterium]|nr:hypothetical protein [Acidimicrobiales bacterium]